MKDWKRAARVAAVALAGLLIAWRAGGAVRVALWALIAASLAEGPVSTLESRIGRPAATVLVTMGALVLAMVLLGAVLLPAASQLARLPWLLEKAGETVGRLPLPEAPGTRLDAAQLAGLISGGGASLVAALAGACASLGAGLARLAAVCALTVFYLLDWERLSLRLALMVPAPLRVRAIGAARAVRRDLGTYLRGQFTVIAAVSALTVTALFTAHAPLPLAMGVMYGALNAIPYIGPLAATVPPVLASLALGWRQAGMTLVLLLIIQQIDNYVISPRVLGAASGMGPAMVLLCLSAGSALGGVWGMFLALPAAVAARAVYRAFFCQAGEGAERQG